MLITANNCYDFIAFLFLHIFFPLCLIMVFLASIYLSQIQPQTHLSYINLFSIQPNTLGVHRFWFEKKKISLETPGLVCSRLGTLKATLWSFGGTSFPQNTSYFLYRRLLFRLIPQILRLSFPSLHPLMLVQCFNRVMQSKQIACDLKVLKYPLPPSRLAVWRQNSCLGITFPSDF